MAIIKKPALFLKSSVMTLNESIFFGNYNFNSAIKDNLSVTDNVAIADSNILRKINEQEQEGKALLKLKSSITSKAEIKQVFDN
ncbi:MAG: hypothetical protein EOP34_08130 [Rickettsiales bacterium]|nr:MAG: hypothetical protein EOP34_08130 [Rickettsiales bacterium]